MEIDGSVLEGGGQILRIALALSSILKLGIKISNIRAGRPKPGLSAQHLKCIEVLKSITNANVKGDCLGSTQIEFNPGRIKGGKYFVDTGTAGSISLILQAVLPVTYFSESSITLDLKGGTNVPMAPQVDFLTEIFRPNLEKFNLTFDFELLKRGYYPKGGGHCVVTVQPVKEIPNLINIDFGRVTKIFGWSFVAGVLPLQLANEITSGAKSALPRNTPIEIETYKESPEVTRSNCSGIILGAETSTGCILGSSNLGSREEKGYETGRRTGIELSDYLSKNLCVDSHTQDQLIIIMALANGVSRIHSGTVTLHTKTAIYIVEQMTRAKFHIVENGNGTSIIECTGTGFKNEHF